ncbi:MAG: GTP cyclohydrolase II [Candidatus Saccharimonadales bacterium]
MKITDIVKHVKKGGMLIIIDDESRENEGDLYVASDKVTPEIINTMINRAGGLVCCAITRKQASTLSLPLMVSNSKNTEKTGVNFTVSVNAKDNVSTGVSAFDRAKTIAVMASSESDSSQLTKPGHVFGLVARGGGLLERDGHTEAAVDMARMAGLNPTGVLCEVVGANGEMAKIKELEELSKELDAPVVYIDELKEHLKQNPLSKVEHPEVVKVASSKLPTKYGNFDISIYHSELDDSEHSVLVMGMPNNSTLVRIHSMCLTGDTFGSERCDCQNQLHQSIEAIAKNGSGILLYLDQEGRGIGLENKIKAYELQDQGLDTVQANCRLGLPIDARDYRIAADILKSFGISSINLLTNNPAKIDQLEKHGFSVNPVPVETEPNHNNKKYLTDKKNKLGHKLTKV